MGKKRAISPRRLAETLISLNSGFTSDFETNKKLINDMTNLPTVLRNKVAGYIARIMKNPTNPVYASALNLPTPSRYESDRRRRRER